MVALPASVDQWSAFAKTLCDHTISTIKNHPVACSLAGIWIGAYAFYASLPAPYYDFNKICGEFNDKNLDVDPYFFDPSKFDWVPMVESSWKIIRHELEDYLAKQPLEPYFGGNLMSQKQCWKVLGLKFWGLNHTENQQSFPKTMAILNKVPGLSLVAFSQIEAGTAITPHNGDTNANIRCHLGLIIPGCLPDIGFQVGDQQKSWEEGKVLMFCDAHRHTAFNYTDKTRIILQFDVIRPEYENQRTLVSARVLASICTQKIVLHVLPWLRGHKLPLRIIYYSLIPVLVFPILTQIGSRWLFDFFLDNSSKTKPQAKQ